MEASDHPRRNFKVRIITFLLLSICIAAAGWIFYVREKAYSEKIAGQTLSAIADLKISQIVNWRKERLGDASVISIHPFNALRIAAFLENPSPEDSGDDIRAWMEILQKSYDYKDAVLTDIHGNVKLSLGGNKHDIQHHLKTDIAEAIRTKKPLFSDFHRSERTHLIHICLFAPLLTQPESRVIGVLILRIDPSLFLYPLIQTWPAPSPSAETLLVRRNSHEVLFLNELRHLKNTALSLRLPITDKELPAARAVLGVEGIIEGTDYRGVPVLADVRRIPNSNWAMVAKVDQKEIFAPLFARIRMIWTAGSGLILMMGLMFLFRWKQREAEFYLRHLDERTQMEMSLQTERDKLHGILESINSGVYIVNQNHDIEYINPVIEKEFGAVNGRKCYQYFHDLNQACSWCKNEEVFKGKSVQWEWYSPKNGKTYDLFDTPIRNEDGTISKLEIFHDITERKRAEEFLRESQRQAAFLADLIEYSSQPFSVAYPDGRLGFCNSAYPRMLGYSKEEFMLLNWINDLTPPEWIPIGNKHLAELHRTGQPVRYEKEYFRKDGSRVSVELLVHLVRDENGEPLHYYSFITDTSERKKAEEALQIRLKLREYADAHTMDDLLQYLLDQAEHVTGSRIGFFHFFDEDRKKLTLQAWSDNTIRNMCTAQGKGAHYPVEQAGVWADCVYQRKPVIHNDYANLPNRKGMPEGHAPVVGVI
jgi:PAS domain S-box-containing protein